MSTKSRLKDDDPCLSICRAIGISLSGATKVQREDDEEDNSRAATAQPRISLACGYAKYTKSKRIWNLRHRAIISESSEMSGLDSLAFSGNLGQNLSPQKPLLCRHARWVARIRERKGKNRESRLEAWYIPLELVQLILRAAELSSMLKQAKNELVNSPDHACQCWSRADQRAIDLEPVFASTWKNYMPNISRLQALDGLLTRAIFSVSTFAETIARPWEEHWDVELEPSSNTLVGRSCPEAVVKAVDSFVRICLFDSFVLEATARGPDYLPKESERLDCDHMCSDSEGAMYKKSMAYEEARKGAIGERSFNGEEDRVIQRLDESFLDDPTAESQPSGPDSVEGLLSPTDTISGKKTVNARQTGRLPDYIDVLEKPKNNGLAVPPFGEVGCDEAKIGVEDSSARFYQKRSSSRETGIETQRPDLDNKPTMPTRKRAAVSVNAGPSHDIGRLSNERNIKTKRARMASASPCADKKSSTVCHPIRRSSRTKVQADEAGNSSPRGRLRHLTSDATSPKANGETQHGKNSIGNSLVKGTRSRQVDDSKDVWNGSSCQERKENTGSHKLGKESCQHPYQQTTPTTAYIGDTDFPYNAMEQRSTKDSDSRTVDFSLTTSEDYDESGGGVARSTWVKLSHIGHISDYHGLQRHHDSFIPLQFKNSVLETLEAIESTMKEVGSPNEEEIDEGILAELKDYEKAVRAYKEKQRLEREERATKKLQIRQSQQSYSREDDECEGIISRPIFFATSSDKMSTRSSNTSCNTVHKQLGKLPLQSPVVGSPGCRRVEMGNLSFWRDEQSNGKRKSRTSEITELKRVSGMMLREMSNTLRFIEEYNDGMLDPSEHHMPEVSIANDSREDNSIFRSLGPQNVVKGSTLEATGSVKEVGEESRHADYQLSIPLTKYCWSRNSIKQEERVKPPKVSLDHSHLLIDYRQLHRRFQTMHPTPKNATINALRECITDVIEAEYEKPSTDVDIKKEEKAHIRIARGYKRKADQEVIEKRKHEEERLLRLREYEYLTRNTKATDEDMEYEELETRPFRFGYQWPHAIRNKKSCKLGACCSLCGEIAANDTSVPMNQRHNQGDPSIQNPRFRNVSLDDMDDDDEVVKPKSRRPSRAAELLSLRTVSLQKLEEMRHILDFIESYNNGLIRFVKS